MARVRPADRRATYFAAFLDLLHKKVVVIGGGKVATTKVRALLRCGPEPLLVIAPVAGTLVRRAATEGRLTWHAREYRPDDLLGAALVFGATDDRELNARVAYDARRLGIPVLAVDDVPNCDFIAPALVRRGDLTLAISTNGRSPAMARRTRERLERLLPPSWADLLEVAASAREQLGATRALVEPDAWQTALDGDVERLASSGRLSEATELLVRRLERSLFEPVLAESGGFVALVGAGPGDPDLLTLRGLQRLQRAEVVVYDRLVNERILDYADPAAERIYVGKKPGCVGTTQSQINALLVDLAEQGRRVVRLKGGDPFVFGRGGEEVAALARAGVRYEVVPGVSSALAAPAAAGIPVTHRGLSSSFSVINGHDPDQHDWSVLALSGGTLVFLMAVEHLEEISTLLIQHGRSFDEPAAVIERATTSEQRVIFAPLGDVSVQARAQRVAAPAVLVVGPTVALASNIDRTAERELAAAGARG